MLDDPRTLKDERDEAWREILRLKHVLDQYDMALGEIVEIAIDDPTPGSSAKMIPCSAWEVGKRVIEGKDVEDE